MVTLIAELLAGIGEVAARAALDNAENITIEHRGEAARYVLHNVVDKIVYARVVGDGEAIRFPRSWRMIVEPFDVVQHRPLHELAARWTVQ